MKKMVWRRATMALYLPHRFTFGFLWHAYMQTLILQWGDGGG